MQPSEYIAHALHNKEVQRLFVSKGIIDLGEIYNILKKLADNGVVDFEDDSPENINESVAKYLEEEYNAYF